MERERLFESHHPDAPERAPGVRLEGLVIEGPQGRLVDGAHLTIEAGRIAVLVGASGSGKTLSARSMLGLVDIQPGIVRGHLEVTFGGVTYRPYAGLDLRRRSHRRELERRFRPLRGAVLGYLPQDAPGSLDPLWTVGRQLRECLRLRQRDSRVAWGEVDTGISLVLSTDDLLAHALDPVPWLARAGFPDPDRVVDLYPHELSGGMAQRAVIALALARGSRFLVADEPTTGLDPTIQEAILLELLRLKVEEGVGILFITHDLRIVPDLADHVFVMHSGRIVEDIASGNPEHFRSEAARALWEATARIGGTLP